jgi:hypothetical protein
MNLNFIWFLQENPANMPAVFEGHNYEFEKREIVCGYI